MRAGLLVSACAEPSDARDASAHPESSSSLPRAASLESLKPGKCSPAHHGERAGASGTEFAVRDMRPFVTLGRHGELTDVRGDWSGRYSEQGHHFVGRRSRREALHAAQQRVVSAGEPDRQRAIRVGMYLGGDRAPPQAQEPDVSLGTRRDSRLSKTHMPREEFAPIVEETQAPEHEGLPPRPAPAPRQVSSSLLLSGLHTRAPFSECPTHRLPGVEKLTPAL
jgi:hypothetical protein